MKPPSMEVLEQRLRGRNTESEESLQKRLLIAKAEMEYGMFCYNQFICQLMTSDL